MRPWPGCAWWRRPGRRCVVRCLCSDRRDKSCSSFGGIRWVRRILRIVAAATRCPSRRSSPWIRTAPQVRLSQAMVRISSTSSSLIGGRPGAFGWRHLSATRRRCQRNSMPGVTIRRPRSVLGRSLDSAASTARSVELPTAVILPIHPHGSAQRGRHRTETTHRNGYGRRRGPRGSQLFSARDPSGSDT